MELHCKPGLRHLSADAPEGAMAHLCGTQRSGDVNNCEVGCGAAWPFSVRRVLRSSGSARQLVRGWPVSWLCAIEWGLFGLIDARCPL